MEISRTVLHRIPDGGYNELRKGTAPVTQISAPVANKRHGMGTPPKSPSGFMHSNQLMSSFFNFLSILIPFYSQQLVFFRNFTSKVIGASSRVGLNLFYYKKNI
jgi:hypothetical protein